MSRGNQAQITGSSRTAREAGRARSRDVRAWASTLSPVCHEPGLEVVDDDMVLGVEPLRSPRRATLSPPELPILAFEHGAIGEAVELVEQVLEEELAILPVGHLAVDDQMILAVEPSSSDPHRWGMLGDAIERWFEQGEAGAWVDGADEVDPWIVVGAPERARHAMFDADDDTDGLVDVFLPRA